MESILNQLAVIVEMTKIGKTIPIIQKRIREQFDKPMSKKRISNIAKSQRSAMKKDKPLERGRRMIQENPDITAQELKEALGLSVTTCYKILRKINGPRRRCALKNRATVKNKRVVRALPPPGLKYDPPCIPASANWPKWLLGEESPSSVIADVNRFDHKIKEEENKEEINIEFEEDAKNCNCFGYLSGFGEDKFEIEKHVSMKIKEYEEEDRKSSIMKEEFTEEMYIQMEWVSETKPNLHDLMLLKEEEFHIDNLCWNF